MKAAATAGYIAVCELHYATVVQCVSQSLFPTQEEMETTKIVKTLEYTFQKNVGYTQLVYPDRIIWVK